MARTLHSGCLGDRPQLRHIHVEMGIVLHLSRKPTVNDIDNAIDGQAGPRYVRGDNALAVLARRVQSQVLFTGRQLWERREDVEALCVFAQQPADFSNLAFPKKEDQGVAWLLILVDVQDKLAANGLKSEEASVSFI